MNPTSLAVFRGKARAQVKALYPATIKIGDMADGVAATTAGYKAGEKLEVGGFLETDDIVFRVDKALLAGMPEVGLQLIWVEQSKTFRIDHVFSGSAASLVYKIGCNGKNQ